MTKKILITLKRAIILADFKAVEKKFESQGIELELIKQYIEDFKKLRDQNRIDSIEKKNIDYWGKKSFEEFKDYLDVLKSQKSKTEQRKMKKLEGAVLFHEDDDWFIYRILNLEASIMYGSGTKWCITQKDNSHFASYSKDKNIYFYISKHRSDDDRFYKIAALVDKGGVVDYWDALDTNVKRSEIEKNEVNLPDVRLDPFEVMVTINGKQYKPNEIPNNLTVDGNLYLIGISIRKLPLGLKVAGELIISQNPIDRIPRLEAKTLIGAALEKTITIDPDIKVEDLVLTHCDIVEIPAFTHSFNVIDLSNSTVGKIYPDIKANELILNKTTVAHIPRFPNVKKLSIQGVKVNTMDLDPTLETLDLSGTKIKKMPGVKLQTFVCRNGRIDAFDPAFNVSKNLILSNTKLQKLPDNMTLESLYIEDTNLTTLPKNLTVEKLDIAGSSIQTLAVEGLKILRSVNIRGCDIVDLGDVSVDKLADVSSCFINSKLRKFPKVPKPYKIENLHLNGSHFEKLPSNMIVEGKLVLIGMPNIKELPKKLTVGGILSLTDTNIKELPPDLNAKVVIAPRHIKVPATAKIGNIIYR